MVSKRWTHSNTTVYNIGYHLGPKYQRKALFGDVERRLREPLYKKAEEMGVSIESIEVLSDHLLCQGPAIGGPALDSPSDEGIFES